MNVGAGVAGGMGTVKFLHRDVLETGQRDIPYIKAWWTLDLPNRRLDLDPPEGLLDVNLVGD